MAYFSKDNIIIAGLVLLLLNGVFGWFSKTGWSDEDVELKIKLHDLEQKNISLEKENNTYELKIKNFKDEYSKIDSITNNSTPEQLDSLFSDYFSTR